MLRRTLIPLFATITLTQIAVAYGADPIPQRPQRVRLMPEKTFIPGGFDDNDNAQLVVSGTLPTTCHKVGSFHTQIDKKTKKVYVTHNAYVYPGCFCLQVTTPYTQTINLGILGSGKYEVLTTDQQNQPRTQGILSVDPSKTAEPDDYVYAPVQEVYLKSTPDGSNSSLVLKGEFTNDCMSLQEVRVLDTSENVIEVLPIAQRKEGSCQLTSRPFETEVSLQSKWKGQTLVYVRSLNGQSISKVLSIQ